ncbi:MAG: GYD domain-containing protein [Dehalococcoidales bacterium]|nr:GYD domain-containing protein [Dehalococcoidales bacterium]
MATYVILSRVSPQALEDPREFKQLASKVSAKIKRDCPGVTWKESFATLGRFDVVDIIETDDPKAVGKVAMILRTSGHETTETMMATPWKEFLAAL